MKKTGLMPTTRKWIVIATAAALWLTGLAWLGLHYFGQVHGEFGPEAHPLEPWMLRLHGALAFLGIWVFGWLWGVHVLPGWRRKERRWSGGGLAGFVIVLIVSGYLLYYLGDEALRSYASITHWALGALAATPFLLHGVLRRRPSGQD